MQSWLHAAGLPDTDDDFVVPRHRGFLRGFPLLFSSSNLHHPTKELTTLATPFIAGCHEVVVSISGPLDRERRREENLDAVLP